MEKEKTSCGSEGNLFASEWAIEYRSTVERQTSNAQLIREKIAASGLSGERQAELVDAVEAKLWVRLSGGFAYYGLRSPNLCLLLSSSLLLLLFYFFFFSSSTTSSSSSSSSTVQHQEWIVQSGNALEIAQLARACGGVPSDEK